MEQESMNESGERVARISFETYMQALEDFDGIDGTIPEDEVHAFYIWLSRQEKFQNIDGYSIKNLYKKNVIETGMDQERFFTWCRDFHFPTPYGEEGEYTKEGEDFSNWYKMEVLQGVTKYSAWAHEQKIDDRAGAVMRFIDEDAQAHYVHTDFARRGELYIDK